jgi:ribonucleotide monophosphatase NagD (HAD superfamily)
MTNGGGTTEADKARQLEHLLNVPVQEQQVVLSHTPMAALARHLHNVPVLVVGRGDVARVATTYGFRRVLTTAQLAAALPGALPFGVRLHPETGEVPCHVVVSMHVHV